MVGDNKIILAADINEHVEEGILAKELKNGLRNACAKIFKQVEPASHMKESDLIDAIWISNNLNASMVSILPHRFGTRDHQVILVDLELDYIIERNMRTCRPKMRRLTCKNKNSVINHNALV